jgi:hypothetical protein
MDSIGYCLEFPSIVTRPRSVPTYFWEENIPVSAVEVVCHHSSTTLSPIVVVDEGLGNVIKSQDCCNNQNCNKKIRCRAELK